MTNKDHIYNSIQYIEANLKEDIDMLQMAGAACCSQFHFIRLFQNITGYSPKKYLLLRRLTECLNIIKRTDRKISEIAYDFQFGSPEAFSRAFKNHFGTNAVKIRQGYPLQNFSEVNVLTKEFIYQSESLRNTKAEEVKLKEILLAGISFFISNENKIEDLSKEWQRLMVEVGNINGKKQPETFYQLQFWSEKQDIEGLYFFIGVEMDSIKDLPGMLVTKTIPAGQYLKFIHKGLANKVGYTYRFIYNQYLPNTSYNLSQAFNFERYGEKCLGPYNENSESDIFIPVS